MSTKQEQPMQESSSFEQDRRQESTSSAANTTTTNSRSENIRVLCLHGKYDNAEKFKTFLTPLREGLETRSSAVSKTVQFDYLDAPFIIGQQQQQQQKQQQHQQQQQGKDTATINPNTSTSTSKREWWTLPPGVRSFEATEYGGFQQSADLVQNALLRENYDFILCHSQGSILMASLLCNPSWMNKVFDGSSSRSSNRDGALSKKPRGYILNGCAWPNPFGELLENFHEQESAIRGLGMDDGLPPPKVLFVMARDDPVNPTKGAERVRDCFMKAASVSSASLEIGGGGRNGDGRLLLEVDSIYHDGDHSLPVHDQDALENILNWIMDGYQ